MADLSLNIRNNHTNTPNTNDMKISDDSITIRKKDEAKAAKQAALQRLAARKEQAANEMSEESLRARLWDASVRLAELEKTRRVPAEKVEKAEERVQRLARKVVNLDKSIEDLQRKAEDLKERAAAIEAEAGKVVNISTKRTPTMSTFEATSELEKAYVSERTLLIGEGEDAERITGGALVIQGTIDGVSVSVFQLVDDHFIPVDKDEVRQDNGEPIEAPSTTVITVAGDRNFSPSARITRAIARNVRPSDFYSMNDSFFLEDDRSAEKSMKAVLRAAFDANLYREEEGTKPVIMPGTDNKGEVIAESDGGDAIEGSYQLVRRKARVHKRPLADELGADVVYIHDDIRTSQNDDWDIHLANLMGKADLHCVGHKDDAVFVAGSIEEQRDILTTLGVFSAPSEKYNLKYTHQVLRRTGVVLGRKGYHNKTYTARGGRLLDAQDGQKLVSSQVYGIKQGTGFVGLGDDIDLIKVVKGLIRPPVVLGGQTEPQGFAEEAQLGREIEAGDELDFFAFDRATEASSSVNQQIVTFTAKDEGLSYYEGLCDQIDEEGIDVLLSEDEQEFMDLGLDASTVVKDYRVKDYARKSDLDGYRSMVIGTQDILSGNEILLPARIIDRLNLEIGDTIRVARDPGQPDGNSINEFTLAGELKFFIRGNVVHARDGIAIDAENADWLDMGGDFDGDSAIVWAMDEDPVGELTDFSFDHEETDARKDVNQKPNFDGSMSAEQFGREIHNSMVEGMNAQYTIGSAVNKVRRGWTLGKLNDRSFRRHGQRLAQGSIDLLKHLVDTDKLDASNDALTDAIDGHEIYEDGEGSPDLIGALSALKMAGEKTNDDAWALVERRAERAIEDDTIGEAATAFAKYLLKLVGLKKAHSIATNGDERELPEQLVKDAKRHVRTTNDPVDAEKELRRAEKQVDAWKQAIAQKIEAQESGDEAVEQRFSSKADRILVRIRALVDRGVLSASAVVAAGNAFVTTRALNAADIKAELSEEEEVSEEEAFFTC